MNPRLIPLAEAKSYLGGRHYGDPETIAQGAAARQNGTGGKHGL